MMVAFAVFVLFALLVMLRLTCLFRACAGPKVLNFHFPPVATNPLLSFLHHVYR